MILGGLLLVLAIAGGAFASYVAWDFPVRYQTQKLDLKVESTPGAGGTEARASPWPCAPVVTTIKRPVD